MSPYKRYEIKTCETKPAALTPNKFKPVVNRVRLARMLLREAFHYKFDPELLLSRPCIYGVFSGPVGGFWPLKQKCVGCMRCVQEYPDMCQVLIDERYKKLGDSYFLPDAITTLNLEATNGKVPVRGVGYKGPFMGPGFDSMWTDMSEIVRPTRDGIYGREYISTAVEIGRKAKYLSFENGMPLETGKSFSSSPVLEIPLPIIFDHLPDTLSHDTVSKSIHLASKRLGTLFVSPTPPQDKELFPYWVPLVGVGRFESTVTFPHPVPMMEVQVFEISSRETAKLLAVGRQFSQTVVAVRLPLNRKSFDAIMELYKAGLGVFHLVSDYHGMEIGEKEPRFIKDSLLDIHRCLVQEGIRDEVTLIASGGIIRAEHLPKVIICGADAVALDTPVPVALHAQFQGECASVDAAHLKTFPVNPVWGTQRIVNFCAAWRNQFLEIVSAMGIRDVRRLRGETGRAMFYEDLEKEAFSWMRE
ncbi:MAG: hypothetical protein HY399_01630 [Elusimicrobia bacterium]|nr:hypothetical protein [Elusimicrobiota bacterium]